MMFTDTAVTDSYVYLLGINTPDSVFVLSTECCTPSREAENTNCRV